MVGFPNQSPCEEEKNVGSAKADLSTPGVAQGHEAGLCQPGSVRILHVINGQYYAGAERVQDLLAQYLPQFGFEVAFAVLKPGLFVQHLRCQRAAVWLVAMRNRLDLRPAWRLARLIRQQDYRLLHAHTPRSLLVGTLAAWLAKVPLIYHVHSPAWADSTRWLFNWANATLEQLLLGRCDRVICVSQALAEQMYRRGLSWEKLVVAPNGVPTPTSCWKPKICFNIPNHSANKQSILPPGNLADPILSSAPKTPALSLQASSSRGSLPSESIATKSPFVSEGPATGGSDLGLWRLGTVALFRPRKGIEVLLEALALLRQQGIPVYLRAVGPFESPQYQAAVHQKAVQLGLDGHVEWTGPVQNVEAELLNMDLFILPSLFGEGLPMVLLEAMAVGMPIIATQIAGIEEVIRPGQEGLLVPPGNPVALAQAIWELIRHPDQAARLGQQARQRHLENYSAQAMAARVAQVYRETLSNQRPSH
ncbi:MAG: glycosyltransferase [Thermoguttaceae bacterium]|nr:glycosyltransferase [Thermoguttaceae bacterium]MDW8039260.1 glycosyltransferase [Thermoguttaceae bacterium]